MSVLLLRLAAPMQSWGEQSRFRRRETLRHPTKSGVLGLLAAAAGRRRSDPIEDLLSLRFGVRVDQPGTLLTDFHTVHTEGPDKPPIITYRDYIADAVFVAGIEGPEELVLALRDALLHPVFPLYLGRRSCPPAGELVVGVVDAGLETALEEVPWQAATHHRRRQSREPRLRVLLDANQGSEGDDQLRDLPLSFDPRDRRYSWRSVSEQWITVANPAGRDEEGLHDWLAVVGA